MTPFVIVLPFVQELAFGLVRRVARIVGIVVMVRIVGLAAVTAPQRRSIDRFLLFFVDVIVTKTLVPVLRTGRANWLLAGASRLSFAARQASGNNLERIPPQPPPKCTSLNPYGTRNSTSEETGESEEK